MTPTLQDFHAECVASFEKIPKEGNSTFRFILRGVDIKVAVYTNGRPAIHIWNIAGGRSELFYGTDIRRAASILYGITGNETWLRFVK